jgi:RHS repeat-associated protein
MLCAVALALFALSAPLQAKYIGEDPPRRCPCESCNPCNANAACRCEMSNTEGNLRERYAGPRIMSSAGPTLAVDFTYNTYNADGSRAQVDTVMGYGWTHSLNDFLFTQRGNMYRFDGEGRVTTYKLGAGGTYTAAPGYFETLVKNGDGSFTLTQKDRTRYRFAQIPNTPFMVGGPVWRLIEKTDSNENTTTLTYNAAGQLVEGENTYGQKITFAYNAQNKLSGVTDSAGRTTTVEHDPTGRKVQSIVGPDGKAIEYTYNSLYQITRKVDKDGRVFTYQYQNGKPVAVVDALGKNLFRLANPLGWATDGNALARDIERVYVPGTTTKTDGRGNQWRYDYDRRGYITRMTAPDGTPPTSFTYDVGTATNTLMLASVTDANNHTTRYEYDGQGNLIREINALGHVTSYTYDPVFNQLTSMTDPNGRVTTYDVDPANGNRLKETDPAGGTRAWTYDSHGNVLTYKDKNGNLTVHTYDAFGNQLTTTDAVGRPEERTTAYTYDAVGNLLTRTDDNIHTTTYQYDRLNRVIAETDAAGNTTATTYDGMGNRIQVIDRNGNPTTFQFDHRQRLVKTTVALPGPQNFTTQTYDGNDNRMSMTDRNGHVTSFQYDVQNRLTKTTDALGNMSTRSYDPVGNVLTECDANNHCTTYTYDVLDRRVTVLDAEGNLTRIGYEGDVVCLAIGCPTLGSSLVSRQIDGNGKYTYFKYDALDRLTTQIRKQTDIADTIDADDAVTRFTYDAHGNRLTMTEPNGNAEIYVYDGLHRVVRRTNAAGDVTLYEYDGVDNLIRTTAPNLNVTTNTYDALDRLIEVNDSVGLVATYSYDAEGNRGSECDGNGNCSINTYDGIYRVVQVTDALNLPTRYEYDPVGNLLRVTDREGNVTTHDYDAINRRISTTDAQPFVTEYEYDRVGNLKAIKAFNDTEDSADPPQLTRYDYDRINRLVQETYPDPAPNTRRFTYDGVGNILTRTDQKGQVTRYNYTDLYFLRLRDYPVTGDDTMSYDLSGRMLTACRAGSPDDVADACPGWLVTYAYDGANRVTLTTQNGKPVTYVYDIPGRTRSMTYTGGRNIVETTDPRARLDTIDDGASPPPVVQYTYDLGNRVITRSYRNGTAAKYTYNANNWITLLEHRRADTSLIAGFGHDGPDAYDNEGNKRFERKDHDIGKSEGYQYDDVYRLVDFKVGTLVGSTVPVPTTQSQYDLDKVGNWKTKTTDGVSEDRDHNAVNEITAIAGVPIQHDHNGNLSEDERYRYGYDEENRLTGVTRKSDNKVVGRYQYDALSRRIDTIADPEFGPPDPVETRYFYDDARIVEEQNPAGMTLATYVYGNYVDEVLTMDRGGSSYYHHQQSLWSVAAITDSTASVVERYAYEAYGLPSITDGAGAAVPDNPSGTPHSAIGNPWMFTGRQFDEETGIYTYRMRYQDPVKGRFLQRDPSGYADGLNLYEYVGSRPTFATDPFGLARCCIAAFNVPINRSGRVLVQNPGPPPSKDLHESFDMQADFIQGGGCCCGCCEYRQYVRGAFTVNGKASPHPLPGGWLGHRWLEDGIPNEWGAGRHGYYGHRSDPDAANDRYQPLPDRLNACEYRGHDDPGFSNAPAADRLRVMLSFRGEIIDICNSNAVLRRAFWAVAMHDP